MKIYKLSDISNLESDTAVTVGMFDGVHIGHQHILALLTQEAQRRNLTPIVVTFDQHPRQILGGCVGGVNADQFYRITTNDERYALLERYGIHHVLEIHFTKELASLSACQFFEHILLQRLRAKTMVLGYDNAFGSKHRNDFEQLPGLARHHDVDVVVDTALQIKETNVSSTQIRKALKQGDVELATAFLGRHYRLWGMVVRGRQVGRQLGFPTANVCLDDTSKVMPADGVYAVNVYLQHDAAPRPGMANFGGQPTFGLDKPVFEVNIFDFDADIYDTVLSVEFVARLRDVQKFSSVPELVKQLNSDRTRARHELSTRAE